MVSIPGELDPSRPRLPGFRTEGSHETVAGGLMRVRSPMRVTMSAYKPPKSEPSMAASADTPAHGSWLEDGHAAGHDHVLAEISHELGNLFHKLYYWAEFLQERRGGESSAAPAGPKAAQQARRLGGFGESVAWWFPPPPNRHTRPGAMARRRARLSRE